VIYFSQGLKVTFIFANISINRDELTRTVYDEFSQKLK